MIAEDDRCCLKRRMGMFERKARRSVSPTFIVLQARPVARLLASIFVASMYIHFCRINMFAIMLAPCGNV